MDRERSKRIKRELDLIIGENIRTERKIRNLTREEFANIIDMTPSHIGLIERGKRGATATTLIRLSRILGKPIDTFFYVPEDYPFDDEIDTPKINDKHKRVLTLMSRLDDKEVEHVSDVVKSLIRLNHIHEGVNDDL